MQLYYSTRIEYDKIILDENESRHCTKVMRMKQGDTLYLTDGKGNLYRCLLADANAKECVLDIADTRKNVGKRDYSLHIAIAPTKNTDRLEWFVEKAVETGIDKITPIICDRSERKHLRTDRLQSIAVSAMKQSLKTYLTEVMEPVKFKDFITGATEPEKYICHCMDGNKISPAHPFRPEHSIILIGPEGDFTQAEAELAMQNGFKELTLGASRMRTETAGLAACMAVYLSHC